MANRYPIILAHGIARFDFLLQNFVKGFGTTSGIDLDAATDGLHYFKGVARHLRNNGFDVHHSSVSFAAGVEQRAEDLRREVSNVLSLRAAEKVHVIGHSMGGLDARHMIVNQGMADKVASVTTVGTPHKGSSFADWALAHKGHQLIKLVSTVIDLGGVADLTTTACQAFNDAARSSEAANEVVYQTYSSAEDQKHVFGPLQPSWAVINQTEGENDGLVARSSQKWDDELAGEGGRVKKIAHHEFPIPADHLNECGWWDWNNQLKITDWLQANVANQIKEYELRIKNVYLGIAQSL
jgi:triacylglycerol lipase